MTGGGPDGTGRGATSPAAMPALGWRDTLGRVRASLARDHIWIAAAGTAFCAVFAAIPVLAVLAAFGALVVPPDVIRGQPDPTGGLLPAQASGFLADQMRAFAQASRFQLGTGLGGAVLMALWTARSGATTLIGACNLAYRERERRGFLRYQAVALVVTAVAGLSGLAALLLVVVPPLAAGELGLEPGAERALLLARWPGLALLTVAALATIYRLAPCREKPRWRWVLPGAVAATALWLAGSAAFSRYVAHFPAYNAMLGALGAVMLILSWFYLASFAVLLGAELNAELERQTERDTTEGRERPAGERGAKVADTVAEGDDGPSAGGSRRGVSRSPRP
jgi:membrane protein